MKIGLLIIESLINGNSSLSIPRTMQTMNAQLLGYELMELPSTNFVRQCRIVAEGVNEILVAIKLNVHGVRMESKFPSKI